MIDERSQSGMILEFLPLKLIYPFVFSLCTFLEPHLTDEITENVTIQPG